MEIASPAATSKITLRNKSPTSIRMRAALYAWSQGNLGDILKKTDTVVISPPVVELRPGGQAVIRIVRRSKAPVSAEESYRLLVEEIPDRTTSKKSVTQLMMRYSLPVFFSAVQPSPGEIEMGVTRKRGGLVVKVNNRSDAHVRLSGMKIVEQKVGFSLSMTV